MTTQNKDYEDCNATRTLTCSCWCFVLFLWILAFTLLLVGRLNVQQEGFISQLHFTTHTQHQVQSSFLSGCCSPTLSCHRPLNPYPKFLHIFIAKTGLLRCCLYTFTDCCHFGFRLSRALAFTLRFWRLHVPTISSFVSIPSTDSTFTLESRMFCCRFSVTFA